MEVEEDEIGEEETGWKLINGDVFRFPPFANILSACVGAGAHLFCVTFLLLTCAITNCFVPTKRGAILTAMIILYACSAPIGGFLSARLYRQFGGDAWLANALFAALIFPVPLSLVFMWVNSVALAHGSSAALPAIAVIIVVALYSLIAFPLTLGGAILGRQMSTDFRAPCRTTRVPREIPVEMPWYRLPPAQMSPSQCYQFIACFP